jgi:hypothetical protein
VNSSDTPDLPALADAAAVGQAIAGVLPDSATPDDVLRFAAKTGLECSAMVESTITCSCPAPSSMPLVRAKWLIEFRFRDGRLLSTTVTRGLIGP